MLKYKYELVQMIDSAYQSSKWSKLPTEVFDKLLKYLRPKDIGSLSISCITIYQKLQSSFYQILKNKVKDWSIYQSPWLCKEARKYLSLNHVFANLQFGSCPRVEGQIIKNDAFEVNVGAQVRDEDGEDFAELKVLFDYLTVYPLNEICLTCTWLCLKTINLQHLAFL